MNYTGHSTALRFSLRPSGQDTRVVNFLVAGAIDVSKVLESRETIVDKFYEISGRKDIVFGDLIWKSRYR